MMRDCFLSVVAPLYNDSDLVENFVQDLTRVIGRHYTNYEVILVDDRSTDDTVERVSHLLKRLRGVRLIQLSRSFGQEIAIAAGLDNAIGDYAVVMLPESDPPEVIPEMVEQSRRGSGIGIVFGVAKGRPPESWPWRIGVRVFYWYCNRLLRLDLPPNTTHFRVLSRPAVNALTQIKDRMRYLHTLSAYVGYRNQRFEYTQVFRRATPRPKTAGESINLAINIVVTNSTQPLRMVSLLGIAAGIFDLAYMGYITAIYTWKKHVAEGWVTQSMQNAVMFFFVLLILSVMSEYLGRILRETRDRPLYYVETERNSPALLTTQRNVVMDSVEL